MKFLLGFCLVLIFTFSLIFGLSNGFELVKGKNHISFNMSEKFYVKDLVKLNPDIEVVSYKIGNKSIAYVNIFGGLGKNFVIENRTYEIIASKNTTLALP